MVYDDLYVLDERGDPQRCEDLLAWANWMKKHPRHVAEDYDGDGDQRVRISTIFLGVSMNLFRDEDDPPLLWETMVFGGVLDRTIARYTSREAAIRGHQEMRRRVNERNRTTWKR